MMRPWPVLSLSVIKARIETKQCDIIILVRNAIRTFYFYRLFYKQPDDELCIGSKHVA